jgi:hypothetical protein
LTGRKLRQRKERKGIGQRMNGNYLRLQTEKKGNKIDYDVDDGND